MRAAGAAADGRGLKGARGSRLIHFAYLLILSCSLSLLPTTAPATDSLVSAATLPGFTLPISELPDKLLGDKAWCESITTSIPRRPLTPCRKLVANNTQYKTLFDRAPRIPLNNTPPSCQRKDTTKAAKPPSTRSRGTSCLPVSLPSASPTNLLRSYGQPQGQMQYGAPPPQQQMYYGPPQGQPQYQQAPPPQPKQKKDRGCLASCLAVLCCCFVCEEGCECCADCCECAEDCC
jgi:hypothetical protein